MEWAWWLLLFLLVRILKTFGKYEHVQKSAEVPNSINVHKMYFHKITNTQLKKQSVTSPPDVPSLPPTPHPARLPGTPHKGRTLS